MTNFRMIFQTTFRLALRGAKRDLLWFGLARLRKGPGFLLSLESNLVTFIVFLVLGFITGKLRKKLWP